MAFTTVFVDASSKPPREIARDARDPLELREEIERLARIYSMNGPGFHARTVQVWADGLYVERWRKRPAKDALYECHDGKPTEDYR